MFLSRWKCRLGLGSFAELAPFQQSSVLWGFPHVSCLSVVPALFLFWPLFFLVCCHLSLSSQFSTFCFEMAKLIAVEAVSFY